MLNVFKRGTVIGCLTCATSLFMKFLSWSTVRYYYFEVEATLSNSSSAMKTTQTDRAGLTGTEGRVLFMLQDNNTFKPSNFAAPDFLFAVPA